MRRSIQSLDIPPTLGILPFEDLFPPLGQNHVQLPYPSARFQWA